MTPERFANMREVLSRRQPDLTVLMENVHKLHNYAAVLRSCDAVGVLECHAIASVAISGTFRSTSASAADWVGVRVHNDIGAAVSHLKGEGFAIVAADPAPGAIDYRELDFTGKVALLLGSELEGVSAEARDLVDQSIVVPMHGMVKSLNVSVAAAVILFEAARQRRAAGCYDRCHLSSEQLQRMLFEWAHPRIASHCRVRGVPYPALNDQGDIVGEFPR